MSKPKTQKACVRCGTEYSTHQVKRRKYCRPRCKRLANWANEPKRDRREYERLRSRRRRAEAKL